MGEPPVPLAERIDLATWPGCERRSPARTSRHYLTLSALVREIEREVEARYGDRQDLRVLDIGCGAKPYLPLLARHAVSHRGIDARPGPTVDDIGGAESLPYADGEFDVVLCTQVLEHLHEPAAAVAEMRRVLAPGGLVLASTHGVHIYHPDPPETDQDYWRWTHSGLRKLFADNGDWNGIDVTACGNVVACVASITCIYVDMVLDARGARRTRDFVLTVLNAIAEWIDRRYPPTVRVPMPGSLTANYLVAASA